MLQGENGKVVFRGRIRLVAGLTSLLLDDVGELLELSLGSEECTELIGKTSLVRSHNKDDRR